MVKEQITVEVSEVKMPIIRYTRFLLIALCLSGLLLGCGKKSGENRPPLIGSAAATSAEEGTRYTYAITCTDADGDALALTRSAEDTCGGILTDSGNGTGTYAFTPSESQGGSTCKVALTCGDGQATAEETALVTIEENNQAPALGSLPASESGPWGRADSYDADGSDSDRPAQALTYSLSENTCPFAPTVNEQSGLVGWNCGSVISCSVKVTVSDSGTPRESHSALLNIGCTNLAPVLSATVSEIVAENRSHTFDVACQDGDGDPVQLARGGSDTCQGSLAVSNGIGTYTLSLDETRGGSNCVVALTCHDTLATVDQAVTVTISEDNRKPSLLNLPATGRGLLNEAASYDVEASDPDDPAQTLAFAVTNHTCAFTPSINEGTGLISWTCSAPGACSVDISVADSGTPGESITDTLTIQCADQPPRITSPAPHEAIEEVPYSHTVLCLDPEGKAVTLAKGPGDTCQGSLQDQGGGRGLYTFTPASGAAGGQCTMEITCADQWNKETQSQAVALFAPMTFTQLDNGGNYSCGLSGGKLYCWGSNASGYLGLGDTVDRYTPARVGGDSDWQFIATGRFHACGIRGGQLHCWGQNNYGMLGLGDTANRHTPARVGSDSDWIFVACENFHTCGIRGAGAARQLYCWGNNQYGQLGLGAQGGQYTTPRRVQETTGDWAAVTLGNWHSCGIRAGEALYCWGLNYGGELGLGDYVNRPEPTLLGPADWKQVATGSNHTCGLKGSGDSWSLYCWGSNGYGALGLGATTGTHTPSLVGSHSDWQGLWAGSSVTCGKRGGGELYCWGANFHGRLGLGDTTNRTSPARVGTLSDWEHAAVGTEAVLGLRGGNRAYGWGPNFKGQLGLGFRTAEWRPRPHGSTAPWTSHWTNNRFSCGINGGRLHCWGYNGMGQLGLGHQNDVTLPTQVGSASTWESLSLGAHHGCAIGLGQLHCWGQNNWYQLGLGDNSIHHAPARVGGESDWEMVSGGTNHSCGIRRGQLYCWGNSSSGQLGLGDTLTRKTPQRVGSGSDWQIISTAEEHTCGIRAGMLFCWGSGGTGRLGLGPDYATRTTPQRVGGYSDWQGVSAGQVHTCGIRAGQLHCWGYGGNGRTGLGSDELKDRPTRVGGDSDWTSVAAATNFSCGIRGGELHCWGNNYNGQLGLGDWEQRLSPARAGDGTDWLQVTGGGGHACARTIPGGLHCWGENYYGQISYLDRGPQLIPRALAKRP